MKTCKDCGKQLPTKAFPPKGSGQRRSRCRACYNVHRARTRSDTKRSAEPFAFSDVPSPDTYRIVAENTWSATAESKGTRITSVEQLLEATQVDLDVWEPRHAMVNTWESTWQGKPLTLYQIKVQLERKISRDIPRAPKPSRKFRPQQYDPQTVLMLPDTQHGYRWARNYQALEPLHDPYAIDCAIQVAKALQPETIVLLGDMLDAAAFGRYRVAPDLRQTITPSLWALHWDLLRLREACPEARIVITPGNHDERIEKSLVDHLPEAWALRGVKSHAEALSIPTLLRLDDLAIEWHGKYGDSLWLWDEVEITHGTKHGRQVHEQIKSLSHTLIQGHAHLHALASKRINGPSGSKLIHAISPGCLCRVDGEVPAASPRVDWHQGLVVLRSLGSQIHAQLVPIIDRTAIVDGLRFVGERTADGLADWMGRHDPAGWPQIANSEF